MRARLGNERRALFQLASTIYLVTQVDIPSLRNSQRLVSLPVARSASPNRIGPQPLRSAQSRVRRGAPQQDHRDTPNGSVPNDFAAVRRACNTATPVISEKSPMSQTVFTRWPARPAESRPADDQKKVQSVRIIRGSVTMDNQSFEQVKADIHRISAFAAGSGEAVDRSPTAGPGRPWRV